MPADSDAGAQFKRAVELLQQREVPPAISCLNEAQAGGYDGRECAAARWSCWMLLGEFERAWAESDLIAAAGGKDPHCFWDGSRWDGKRIMLRCLHGLGDTIQFIRYAPLLKQTCRSLTVQTHPELVRLVRCVAGIDRVITWGQGIPEDDSSWDMQMEVTELARAFRTAETTIPNGSPYISVPATQVRKASRELQVGVTWQGGAWDPRRHIPMAELTPILARKECRFFALQKGTDQTIADNLLATVIDVYDTAMLMQGLDLVITVDTMIAHLAGAMGLPVWILLPRSADWRWMLKRRDTPWYGTAQLFRQEYQGNWQPVIAEVDDCLGRAIKNFSSCSSLVRQCV